MDRRLDIAFAVGFMVLGLVILWQASGIRMGVMRDPVGPRAAFYFCGAIMAGGGALVVLRHWRALRRGAGHLTDPEGSPDTEGVPASLIRAAALAGLCFAYALLFNPLGYLLATPPFIIAALAVLNQRRWLTNVLIAVTFTLIAYVVFGHVLGVRLPHGPLTQLFRDLGLINL